MIDSEVSESDQTKQQNEKEKYKEGECVSPKTKKFVRSTNCIFNFVSILRTFLFSHVDTRVFIFLFVKCFFLLSKRAVLSVSSVSFSFEARPEGRFGLAASC